MKVQGYAVDMSSQYFSLEASSSMTTTSTTQSLESQESFSSDKSDGIKKLESDLKEVNEMKNELSQKLAMAAISRISAQRSGINDTLSIQENRIDVQSLEFKTKAIVQTEDREIELSLDISLDRSFVQKTSIDMQSFMNLYDPLVINLDGTMPTLSSDTFAFDIDSDGQSDQISKLREGNGFLALDKNENGTIDGGSELFGTKSGDGFKDLKAYDDDGNGWIDENDAIFDKLRIWQKTDNKDELMALGEVGIGAIFLEATDTPFSLKSQTNELLGEIRKSSMVLFEDSRASVISHIDFAVSPETQNNLNSLSKAQRDLAPFTTTQTYEEQNISGLKEQIAKIRDMLDDEKKLSNGLNGTRVELSSKTTDALMDLANRFQGTSSFYEKSSSSVEDIKSNPYEDRISALKAKISALQGKLASVSGDQKSDIRAQINSLNSQVMSLMSLSM